MTTAEASPRHSPAPWADIAPGYGPVTVDMLLTLPDDGYIYEVVDGILVRMAGSGKQATRLAMRLGSRLALYVDTHRLGVVTGADGVYKFPGAETGLIPDLGFYTAERDALAPDDSRPIPFAPDLAVEVASPSQMAVEMAAKVRLYLQAGTRLVWVIWPLSQHIDIWRPDLLEWPSTSLAMNGLLDGEDVVQGFSYAVADLFTDPLRQEQSTSK